MGRLDIDVDSGRSRREGRGEKGGTHDDEVDERERGVAMSELAVL